MQTFFCLSCYLIKMHCFRTGDTAEIIYFSTVYHLYLTQMIRIPFHFDAYPYLTFHSDPDPDPTCQFETDTDPDPTAHFFPDLDVPMLKNDHTRLLPFHFDADPAFHF